MSNSNSLQSPSHPPPIPRPPKLLTVTRIPVPPKNQLHAGSLWWWVGCCAGVLCDACGTQGAAGESHRWRGAGWNKGAWEGRRGVHEKRKQKAHNTTWSATSILTGTD